MTENDIITAVLAVMYLACFGASWYFFCFMLGVSLTSPIVAIYAIGFLGCVISSMWFRGELNR